MGLEVIELIMALEEEFGVEISSAEVAERPTPRTLINIIEEESGKPRHEIAEFVRAAILESTNIKETDYDEDSDLVRDLHLK